MAHGVWDKSAPKGVQREQGRGGDTRVRSHIGRAERRRTMGAVYDAMVRFFDEDDWKYQPVEGKAMLRMGFSGDNGKWTCIARAVEEADQFIFYSIAPASVPEEKRVAMAEFITRANYGMRIGNFEMDFSDGELRYKSSIDVEGDRLSSPLVKHMVYPNVLMMDKYLPGIMAIIYAGKSPQQAVQEIEG